VSVEAGPPAGVVGHEEVRALLRRVPAPSSAFVGPDGVGRRRVAAWWAQWLNCAAPDEEPCGRCESCRLAQRGAHPDLRVKAPAATTRSGRAARRPQLTIDQMVPRATPDADPEPLSRWLEQRPRFARRVGVVDDAHTLNEAAGNAFLKMLEEPPSWAVVVLVAPGPEALLPTLASRCLVVRFGAAPVDGFEDLAPHPGLRAGRIGRLLRARADADAEQEVREAATALLGALDGPLDEALAAGRRWLDVWTARPELDPAELLLEYVREAAPARYPVALEAVRAADEALRAYVSLDVVAHALTLRLRRAS
jgi:hypothetical protein